jgi:multidrug efflux pump subunit AcrB
MTLRQRVLLAAIPALVLAAGGCSRSTGDIPLPAITVEAAYPGANAEVVADTVAAPIEQQVNGVEKMVHMTSRSASDGTYRLTVAFERGTDLNIAQVLVQNRVSLAEPILPDLVNRNGVTTRKGPAGLLALVTMSSPDSSRDTVWLSNYAATNIQDELARVPGVGDVVPFGESQPRLTVWLDPEKIAARDLTAGDIIHTLEQQNAEIAAGALGEPPMGKGKEFRVAVSIRGRLADAEELANVIVRKDAGGGVVRLKDVARVEAEADVGRGEASLNGKPVVLLALYLLPGAGQRRVGSAVEAKVAELSARCPQGVRVDVAFDFTPNLEARSSAPDYLVLDPTFAPGASAEQTRKVVQRCEALVREVAGVQDVLALPGNPFDSRRDRPCILVRLAPARGRPAGREQVAQAIRDRLGQLQELTVRLRDLSAPAGFPRCAYPIDLTVCGDETDRVRELATKLAQRLRQSEKLTDVEEDPESSPRPQLALNVDRAKADMLGVTTSDISATLQASFGVQLANDPDRPGRTWQVKLPADANTGDRVKDIQRLRVRNVNGDMVPLGTLVTVREVTGPEAVNRLDFRPMVEITANLAADVPPAQGRGLCESLADEVRKDLGLPAAYQLTWLR